MTWDLQWDDEVDVVCTDGGVAGLAAAISAVDEGAEVLVASASEVGPAGSHGWFTVDSGDAETVAYLGELTADLDTATLPLLDGDLPIRLVSEPVATAGRREPPFFGSHLRDWAARCIPSPSGYLYTRVTDWNSTEMVSGDGEAIVVSEIGTMGLGPGDIGGSVLDWLNEEARSRDVDVKQAMTFDRLVFEEGAVIGAVFMTSRGPWAVRARHGVLYCRAGLSAGRAVGPTLAEDADLRVALVGKGASRFGRVELLTSAPALAQAAATSSGAPTQSLEPA